MRFFINAHMVANRCSDTLWPYAPLALVTMVPRGSTPGQMYASTPALKVCNHSRRVYWEACETGKLPMTAVARERSSSGTAADQTMSPRCASSPTNSCGTSRAALAKARRSPSLSGRQLTISLCVFSIPMVHQTRRQGRYYRGFLMLNQCRTATGPMPNPPHQTPPNQGTTHCASTVASAPNRTLTGGFVIP